MPALCHFLLVPCQPASRVLIKHSATHEQMCFTEFAAASSSATALCCRKAAAPCTLDTDSAAEQLL
jgi:hypothetical protein